MANTGPKVSNGAAPAGLVTPRKSPH
jgi:hypothetical protein